MKLRISIFFALFLFIGGFAQKNKWTKARETVVFEGVLARATQPSVFALYQLDFDGLVKDLKNAPQRFSNDESVVIIFPDSDGNYRNYIVQEASVMEPELQAQYPDMRAYIGWEKEKPENSIRFSVTPQDGLHVMYFDNWDVSYLDRYTNDNSTYIIYKRKDLPKNNQGFTCDVEDTLDSQLGQKNAAKAPLVTDGQFRTYRLAMAATREYTTFHGGTVAGAMSAINTTMTRVNGVYEKTISSTMVLVANNNLIIYTVEPDPYTNNSGGTMLGQNQTNLDIVIGTANYDIGHVFSTGGGGIAQLNSVCNASGKARGVTGLSAPVGDPFDIDYVAHEIGHQFGGTHTFRYCAGNETNATAFEPGSGSTIMAYAGICPYNVQNNSDPYFHAASVVQMYSHVTQASDCSVKTPNGNGVPVANAGNNYIIPRGTAFVLTATGSDPNGDPITYLWEQVNNQNSTQPPVNTNTVGPNYRSRLPTSSPMRYFPIFSSVLANNLYPTWEVTPNVARTMIFNVLVNDNKVTGNQAAYDDMQVTVTSDGPFTVTSHTTNTNLPGGSSTTVTWNVAGTNAGTINTQNVEILVSTDGGANFNSVLASTPNDGSQAINLPNVNSSNARIMVRAVGNIYYALNSSNFSITQNLATQETEVSPFVIYPNPATNEVFIDQKNRSEKADYLIYDNAGRLIKQGNFKGNARIGLESFVTGNYTISVRLENGEVFTEKLIVEKK